MEFFNHIHCKYTGVKGFVRLYEDGLRYRMLTEKAKYKAKVLVFWEKHGLEAALDEMLSRQAGRPSFFGKRSSKKAETNYCL